MSLLNRNNFAPYQVPVPQNNGLAQIKQAYKFIQSAANPTAALQQAAQNNPALGQVMNLCAGKNPEQVFYELCKMRGVNPQDVINQLKS